MRSPGILTLTLALSLVIGCDAVAPADVPETAPPPNTEAAALRLALDDVLVRILPAIGDGAGGGALGTHVAELASALTAGDASRLSRSLGAAQEALDRLAGSPGAGEEHGADLSAIQLVIEQLADLPAPLAPLHGTSSR